MHETVVYNVWHLEAYGMWVLAYFFMGGMSGGSFLVSAFATVYGREKYQDMALIGGIASLALVVLGGICLLLDLGRPLRFFYLFTSFHVTSPISWGGVIISFFSLCNFLYLYFMLIARDEQRARMCARAGIVLAIALTSYTGLLLSMAKARPLWHSAIMPPLFLVSSSISGCALVLLLANLLGRYDPRDQVTRTLVRVLIVLILVDIFFLSDMYVLYVGIAEAHEVALLLLVGKFAFLFWGIELALGSVVPVIMLVTRKVAGSRSGQILASLLALGGVFTMRYIILMVGQYLPLS